MTAGAVSSVVLRLAEVAPPARNSATVPVTVTASPTAGLLPVEPVKTNRPSLVAGSASGAGSWNQKPVGPTAVTTPGTSAALTPTRGDTCDAPCRSWIRSPGTPGSGGGGVLPVLRGFGVPAAKSAALLSVSGPSPRRSAVVLDRPGAAAVSKSFAVP